MSTKSSHFHICHVCRSMKVQVYALWPRWRKGQHELGGASKGGGVLLWQRQRGVGGIPGDDEPVAMLIVHFQSSIKFNSHSASTCYSNSVTEHTSGMHSHSFVSSIPPLAAAPPPPLLLCFLMTPRPPSTPLHLFLLLLLQSLAGAV